MDVSRSYGISEEKGIKSSKALLLKMKLRWPDVLLQAGWDDATKVFGQTGYGIVVIDPAGKVAASGIHARDLKAVLRSIHPESQDAGR